MQQKIANEFERKFECLGKIQTSTKRFPIEKKVTEIDKDGNESVVVL